MSSTTYPAYEEDVYLTPDPEVPMPGMSADMQRLNRARARETAARKRTFVTSRRKYDQQVVYPPLSEESRAYGEAMMARLRWRRPTITTS